MRGDCVRFCIHTKVIADSDMSCGTGMVLINILNLRPEVTLMHSPWFPILLACAMIERLAAFASDIAIERDWVTQVSDHCPQCPALVENMLTVYSIWGCKYTLHKSRTFLWCAQLSGKANQGALTQSNSNLRRLDLLSEVVGTFLFGTCLSNVGASRALAALAVFSGAVLPYALVCINKACPGFSCAWYANQCICSVCHMS